MDYAVVLDNIIVLQGIDHTLHFIDMETGDMYWQFRFYAPVTLYKVDDFTLIALSDNIVHSLDVENRRKIWTYRLKRPEFQNVLVSLDRNQFAVKYGKKSHEIFEIRDRVYPVGISEISEKFEILMPPVPLEFDPETVRAGSRLELEGRAAKYFPTGADEPAWTFAADLPLARTAVLLKREILYLIDSKGTIYHVDPETGAVTDKTDITKYVQMRFWDEKPENLDNYSNAFLLTIDNAIYVIGPSSFSKMKFLRFPETISLDERKRDTTFNWALEKAINAWDEKKYADAVRGMKEVVDIWPESPLAHLFMGMALSTIGNIDESINELDYAHKLEPGNPDIIANLAGNCILKIMSLNPETQSAKIIELYEKVKRIQPVNRMAYIGLAELYLGRRDFEKAIDVIEESFNYGFFSPDLHMLLLSAYYMSNRKEEALNLVNDLILLFPHFDVPYLIKGKILCKQGRYSVANEVFSNTPERPDARRELVSLFPRLLTTGNKFFYGNAVGLSGDYKKGKQILEDYISGFPTPEELEKIREFYSHRQKNPSLQPDADLLPLLQRFTGKSPLELEAEADFRAPSLLAIAHFQFILNMKETSLETLAKVEETGQDDPETQSYMGYLYSLNDQSLDKAEKYVLSALEVDPEDSIFLRNYGVFLTTTGKYKEAEEAFKKAVANNPNTELLFYEYGNLLMKMRRKKEAAEQYRKELEMTPDLKLARDALQRAER
ncbi:tetratricopeptide repeat protein [bacterium]